MRHLVLIYAFSLVLALVLVLTGCATTHESRSPDMPVRDDPSWRATSVQALAYDIRCDGEQDFRADCRPEVQDRLDALKGAGRETLDPLIERARELNENWSGR